MSARNCSRRNQHDHLAAHLRFPPRPRSESLAIAATFLDECARPTPASRSSTGTSGTARARVRRARRGRQDGDLRRRRPRGRLGHRLARRSRQFKRFDSADYYLFTVPMWNASVRYILSSHRRHQPARHDLRLRPRCGLHRSAGEQAGRRHLHRRGLRPRPWPRLRQRLPAAVLRGLVRWAGVDDIRRIAFRPNVATADPEADAAPHTPRQPRSPSVLSTAQPALWRDTSPDEVQGSQHSTAGLAQKAFRPTSRRNRPTTERRTNTGSGRRNVRNGVGRPDDANPGG